MKIKWLGHASFLIEAGDGKRIITDPYEPGSYGGAVGYKKIEESADIVTVSHEHEDHNCCKDMKGSPEIVKGTGEKAIKGIKISGVPSYHDSSGGSERGENTIFSFEIDGMKVCHLGDLGHLLSDEDSSKIGDVDVLLIPVGGFYTIDAAEATKVVGKLNPKVVVPMHYKTEVLGFDIAGVDNFLADKKNVKRLDSSEIELKKESLPAESEIVVLKHAL